MTKKAILRERERERECAELGHREKVCEKNNNN